MHQADRSPVRQKTIEDFTAEKPDESRKLKNNLAAANTALKDKGVFGANYDDLFSVRAGIKEVLIELGAMNKKGRIALYKNNPYGRIANELLDVYASTEMMIGLKAALDLQENGGNTKARMAIERLILAKDGSATKDFTVIDQTARLFRRFGLLDIRKGKHG
jgi:hypothetical protein